MAYYSIDKSKTLKKQEIQELIELSPLSSKNKNKLQSIIVAFELDNTFSGQIIKKRHEGRMDEITLYFDKEENDIIIVKIKKIDIIDEIEVLYNFRLIGQGSYIDNNIEEVFDIFFNFI